MRKVKATKISRVQSVLQDFSKEHIESPNNELYCNLCSCTVTCNKRFLVKVTEAFLSAVIPLYKLNNEHIKIYLFHDIGSVCRLKVLVEKECCN